MATQHTPQRNVARDAADLPAAGAAGAAGAATAAANLPLSSDQFKVLMEQYRMENAPRQQAAALPQAPPAAPAPVEVNSVAVKLPSFWSSDPDLWFLQVEAVFDNRTPRITQDSTKYNHVLAALPQEVARSVRQVIRLPATTPDRYDQLKAALDLTYGKTPAKKNDELIEFAASREVITDIKPSVMLMHIRDLSANSYQALERAIFLCRLPHEVRMALADSTALNNDLLAKQANVIVEEYLLSKSRRTRQLAVSAVDPARDSDDDNKVLAVERRPYQRPKAPNNAAFLCYVHSRYGSKAFTCRSSKCTMRNILAPRPPGNDQAGRQ